MQAQQQRLVTILLNKPIGYVSGQPEPGYQPAVNLINPETQFIDKRFSQRFNRPDSKIEKEYLVWVEGSLPKERLALRSGFRVLSWGCPLHLLLLHVQRFHIAR